MLLATLSFALSSVTVLLNPFTSRVLAVSVTFVPRSPPWNVTSRLPEARLSVPTVKLFVTITVMAWFGGNWAVEAAV